MVGRLLSSENGLFLGDMLVFGGVNSLQSLALLGTCQFCLDIHHTEIMDLFHLSHVFKKTKLRAISNRDLLRLVL